MHRWAKMGALDRLFAALRELHLVNGGVEVLGLDSTSVKVHPDGTGAQKNGPQSIGKSRGGWNTKIHLISISDRLAMIFSLSGGQAHDAPEGRAGCKSTRNRNPRSPANPKNPTAAARSGNRPNNRISSTANRTGGMTPDSPKCVEPNQILAFPVKCTTIRFKDWGILGRRQGSASRSPFVILDLPGYDLVSPTCLYSP